MAAIGDFNINYIHYLNEKGEAVAPLPEFALKESELIELYRLMTLIRKFDAKVVSLQRTGKMGTFASSLGQEAVSVGAGHALRETDLFCPYYRDQGALIQRKVKLVEILQYWGGDERGNRFADNQEDFPIAIPIATQLLHAVGAAYAIKLRKQQRAVLTICGDGASSEGDFNAALNGAGTWQLPLVFVINNNQWAISVPRRIQTKAATLAQKGIAAGIECLQVDGNDVIAVCKTVADALDKARAGEGPTLIEALSYRLCDHTTADDASRYIGKAELEQAWTLEPVIRLQSYLRSKNILSSKAEETIERSNQRDVDEAVSTFLNLAPQPPESIFDFHYVALPNALLEQRNELASYLQSENGG
jgi:pyruvate dehydrogenase E1 component alpha subunit